MRKRILLIEDNEGDQILLREALIDAGLDLELVVTNSGEEGVAKAADVRPDIVITDTNMLGMDGFETCRKIKDILGDKTFVITMTGAIDAFDVGKAKKARADGFCVKTADWTNLLDTIRLYLRKNAKSE